MKNQWEEVFLLVKRKEARIARAICERGRRRMRVLEKRPGFVLRHYGALLLIRTVCIVATLAVMSLIIVFAPSLAAGRDRIKLRTMPVPKCDAACDGTGVAPHGSIGTFGNSDERTPRGDAGIVSDDRVCAPASGGMVDALENQSDVSRWIGCDVRASAREASAHFGKRLTIRRIPPDQIS